jgi:hypothetical protein
MTTPSCTAPAAFSSDSRFEFTHYAPEDPAGKHSYGDAHSVIQLATTGEVVLGHAGPAKDKDAIEHIRIFTPDFNYVRSFNFPGSETIHDINPQVENGQEVLYCSVQGNGVKKVDLQGNVLVEFDSPADPETGKYTAAQRAFVPTQTAKLSNGIVLVADGYGASVVTAYDIDGKILGMFGEGELNSPHGISIDTRSGKEIIAVSDRGNNRIIWYDPSDLDDFSTMKKLDGELTDHLSLPCGAVFEGDFMVVPDLDMNVAVFDKDNQHVVDIGKKTEKHPNYPGVTPEDRTHGRFDGMHYLTMVQQDGRRVLLTGEWVGGQSCGRVTQVTIS